MASRSKPSGRYTSYSDHLHRKGRREGPGVPRLPERRHPDLGSARGRPGRWLLRLPVCARVRHAARWRRGVRGPRASHPRRWSVAALREGRGRGLRGGPAGRRLQGREPERDRGLRLRLLVPGGRRRRSFSGLTRALGGALLAAALLAACGGDQKPKPAPPKTSPGPAKGTEGPPPDAPALAVGITEPNPNFFAVGDVAAEFSRWRDELVKLHPAYYRVIVDWSGLQPEAGKP